jgi:UDP-3-O-[3-hydroxymyristoyl] glucosamine N-acyltransferase
MWSGTTIAHDTTVGDYSFFGPRAAISGHVKIGKRCVIGLNATIKDHVSVADETLVAAGALVVKDTSPRSLWKSAAAILSTKKSTDVKKI